jgi:hypothetical protein
MSHQRDKVELRRLFAIDHDEEGLCNQNPCPWGCALETQETLEARRAWLGDEDEKA